MGELVGGDLNRVDRNEVVAVLAREMGLQTNFKPAFFPDVQKELLRIDEVNCSIALFSFVLFLSS